MSLKPEADQKTPQLRPEANGRPVWRGTNVWLAGVVITGSLACSLLTSRGGPTPESMGTPVASRTTPEPVISAFDASEASFLALHDAIDLDPASVIAEAQAALASADPETHFAAVYALGLAVDAENADILRPVLEDPELALRAIAAGALIGLGEAESLPVLIEALDSDELLPYSHPPRPVWILADSALSAYTGMDFGIPAGADQRAASAAGWKDWWEANGAALTWDGFQWKVQP